VRFSIVCYKTQLHKKFKDLIPIPTIEFTRCLPASYSAAQ